MLDLDKFIKELDRLTTVIHFYDEIYCDKDAVKVLSALSSQAASIIQLSLHNDIIMSVARLLFDGEAYKVSGNTYEFLSQYNLAKKYESYIDTDLQLHRDTIVEIKKSLNVKEYRDLILAHNDKATLTGKKDHPKHNIETTTLLEILHQSRCLFFGIRVKITIESGETSLPTTDCNIHRNGAGTSFIQNIKNITSQVSGTPKSGAPS